MNIYVTIQTNLSQDTIFFKAQIRVVVKPFTEIKTSSYLIQFYSIILAEHLDISPLNYAKIPKFGPNKSMNGREA